MKSLDEIADFIAARDNLRGMGWQVFDLSAAKEFTDEMFRQYEAGGQWHMPTPPPAANCVFWDGHTTVFVQQNGQEVFALIGEEWQLAEMTGYIQGKAAALRDLINIDPKCVPRLKRALGERQAQALIEKAQSGVPDYEMRIEKCKIGGSPADALTQCVAVWSEFIAFPIAHTEPKQIARPTRRRLQRMGVEIQVRTVSLSPARHKTQDHDHSPGERRALHFCRGHWRRNDRSETRRMINGEWRIWIAGHWKGDPDKGVVLHDYLCNILDLDLRSKLIA